MIPALVISAALIWTVALPAGERVKITTPSGAVLAGDYLNAGPGAPGVLFFPMCRADAMTGWAPVAERLFAARVSSLMIAYRGYGESTSAGSGDQRAADADAALAYLRSRVGDGARLGVAGSSCGVYFALTTASRHPEGMRALVALTGPHSASQVEFVRNTPGLAVFSGAAALDGLAPGWARELKQASSNAASRLALPDLNAHGTDIFPVNPALAHEIGDWLAERLNGTKGAGQEVRPAAEPPFRTTGAFFAVSVANVRKSADWYSEKLGLKVVWEMPPADGAAVLVLEGGGLTVELVQLRDAVPWAGAGRAGKGRELVHGIFKAGLTVEDFDKTVAALKARNVDIAYGPFPKRESQRANVVIRDGDGNLIQFFGQ